MTDAPVTVTLPSSVGHALTVHSGDRLIVRVSPRLNPDQIAHVKDTLRELLPGVEPVVIAADEIGVYRPDDMAVRAEERERLAAWCEAEADKLAPAEDWGESMADTAVADGWRAAARMIRQHSDGTP